MHLQTAVTEMADLLLVGTTALRNLMGQVERIAVNTRYEELLSEVEGIASRLRAIGQEIEGISKQ